MSSTKLLQLSIDTGNAILDGKVDSSTYQKWYTTAENNLATALGKNWGDSVLWDGYSWGSDPALSPKLRQSIKYLELAKAYPEERDSSSQIITSQRPEPAAKSNQPELVARDQAQTFIVHGHDKHAKLDLKNFLQNTLKLPEPIILQEQAESGRAIVEKFELYAAKATFVFVLLTPDDKLAQEGTSSTELYRARQNVIFEMGYFFAKLGRGRVVLLHKGPLDLPSDIGGLVYIPIPDGVEAAGVRIRKELAVHVRL